MAADLALFNFLIPFQNTIYQYIAAGDYIFDEYQKTCYQENPEVMP